MHPPPSPYSYPPDLLAKFKIFQNWDFSKILHFHKFKAFKNWKKKSKIQTIPKFKKKSWFKNFKNSKFSKIQILQKIKWRIWLCKSFFPYCSLVAYTQWQQLRYGCTHQAGQQPGGSRQRRLITNTSSWPQRISSHQQQYVSTSMAAAVEPHW